MWPAHCVYVHAHIFTLHDPYLYSHASVSSSHPHVFFPYPPYPSFIYPPLSLGRHTHFLTQACRNQASSTTPIFLSFILHPTPSLTWSLAGACYPSLLHIPINIPPGEEFCPPTSPAFSGCLTSGILSAYVPPFSGCLTSGILSAVIPPFSGCLTSGILSAYVPPSPDVSHPEFYPPPFHLLQMFHIRKFVRRHSTFSGYFIFGA